jgi:tryptophanyl-tRNA synthetase
MSKKTIFSGIQPSGNLHLGNYLGAVKNWVELQAEPASTREDDSSTRGGYDPIFCIVDLHAITAPQDPETLRQKTLEIAKVYLAAGIDPEKSTLFIQSHIPQHSELMWILNTITKISELEKMTQFKDKAGIQESKVFIDKCSKRIREMSNTFNEFKQKEKYQTEKLFQEHLDTIKDWLFQINELQKKEKVDAGLFNYPILMASDILLYNTEMVPVGEDQVQHIELARDLAKRFNHKFGETFTIPKAFLKEEGMRVMGLDNPTKKMSKSAESKYNRIELLDSPEEIKEKFMKAVTDSGSGIEYSDDRPALKNLINIFSSVTERSTEEIASEYKDKGYKEFKESLAEAVIEFLKSFQEKYHKLQDEEVLEILHQGAKKLEPIAQAKMKEVKEKVGFVIT